MRTRSWLTLGVLFVVGCGPSSAVVEDVVDGTGVDEAELRALSTTEIVGTLAVGQTATVVHPGGAKYRAFRFVAAGGPVDLWVRSANGDAKAWLLASNFGTIARNDDASLGVSDAHLARQLGAGTYYLAFKESGGHPATFAVTFNGTGAADAGSPVVPLVAPATPDAGPHSPKRIFVTRTAYDGDLRTAGGGVDGLDGADRLCTIAAISTNLGGTWKAFLSTSQVNAIDRIAEVGPWLNLWGHLVFRNKVGMAVGPLARIDYNERSESTLSRYVNGRVDGVAVWTGTTRFMTLAWVPGITPAEAATCSDWTSDSGQAELGTSAATDGEWTQYAHAFGFPEMLANQLILCRAQAHLICIEQ